MSARCPTAERNGRPCVLACPIYRPAAAAAPIVGDEVHAQDVVCVGLHNERRPGAFGRARFERPYDDDGSFVLLMPMATIKVLELGRTYRLTIAPVTPTKGGDE